MEHRLHNKMSSFKELVKSWVALDTKNGARKVMFFIREKQVDG